MLRLAGKGIPAFADGAHGDLFLRIHVRVPDHLSDQEAALYEKPRNLAAKRRSKERPKSSRG